MALEYKVKLPVIIMREGDKYVAHTPALDLATCGDTPEKAKKRFEEALDIFMTEAAEMGTLEDVLLECGWRRLSTRSKRLIPPKIVKRMQESISIPCPV